MDEENNKPQKEKLLDHNYDGIQELDNPLPQWWRWLFYGTVVFSVIYYIAFTFFIPSSFERIEKKVNKIKGIEESASEEKTASEAPLEEGVFLEGPQVMKQGKAVYVARCLACHGALGEGLVGPNMTDKYWIHGTGSLEDMYEVVVKGVPEKGMISWEPLLSDADMRAVTVYMKTLQGTNPPNAKAPEGELVE